MDLEQWMKIIKRALVNEDPHIRWLFIPVELYDYTVFVHTIEEEGVKELGIQFLKTTKPDLEFEDNENMLNKVFEAKEIPKGMYS